EETYSDRGCGKIGIHYGDVDRMLAPYLRPQESGAHIGVRAAMVTDELGHGLSIIGKDLLVSALPYKPSEIENADHHFDLPEKHYTYVRVGLAQMGVSGDDTWGARTLPQYMIKNNKTLRLRFSFQGI
ncbi:MAG: beta-galactosidase, partial [Lachnospiraceae bacterium]|nr:beta-galactosidase [Lachnospiraceae bacterium]